MTKEQKIAELINIRDNYNYTLAPREVFDDAIKALLREPNTGHWIKSDIPNEEYVCSECGGACWYYDYQASVAKSRYCPNCGAKMEAQK